MSESDAFGDLCDALQEKYNMDHEDFQKLVKLYNDREGFMSKHDAFCASAATTIAVLEKLQSTLGPMLIQELCDRIGKATPEDETKPEWVNAVEAVKSVGNVVAANIRSMIRTIAADAQGAGLS